MPIMIPDALPAARTLESENIFVMTENRAQHQDIRPLKIAILNLMPNKVETETQLLRLLGNTPLQIDIELLQTASHDSKNTSKEHLFKFYRKFADVRDERFDGLIITGAPVETLDFHEVDYWDELCGIMEWSKTHVYSTFHICWAAQAGLYYHYGVEKYRLGKKLTGIFRHRCLLPDHPLMRGFDDIYMAPHSRYTSVSEVQVKANPELDILGASNEAGLHIVADRDCRRFFVMGHSEYDRATLKAEFERDCERGLDNYPLHYFPYENPDNTPYMNWRAHANLLFSNWVNHIVYQHTPFDLASL